MKALTLILVLLSFNCIAQNDSTNLQAASDHLIKSSKHTTVSMVAPMVGLALSKLSSDTDGILAPELIMSIFTAIGIGFYISANNQVKKAGERLREVRLRH